MMKQTIFNLIQRFRNLIYNNYLFIYNNVSLLNIITIIFLLIILYYFICDLYYNGFLGFLLPTIISFYIFYKYSYSQIFKTIFKYCFIFIITLFIIFFLIVHFELISVDGFNLDSNNSKIVEDNTNTFISSDSTGNNDFINNHITSLFVHLKQILIDFVRPVPVEGYLDDLLGQQLFIHFLLIIIVVSLIFLFSVFLFIQILLYNKDYILKRFNNKFVLFYIKYQILLSKISLFILPVFIMFGLIELFIGLYFIITHPIPYDLLPVDLHFYFKK